MNKKIGMAFLGAMTLLAGWSFSQENGNLLKNSELKFNAQGQLPYWYGKCTPVSGPGYKGANSACLKLEIGQTTMLQAVNGLKPGKYIFSAYIKLDRKIWAVVLVRIIKLDGKDVYQTTFLKPEEQPEPGAWDKIMAEFDIPEGTDAARVAFDLRDKSGTTVWIDSPSLTYKAEQ